MNVLIIGLGSIALKHVKALERIDPKIKIYALRSKHSKSEETGITNIYSDSEVDFNPSFVIISNPTSEHYSTIDKAIKWNCPLFIEKPSLSSVHNSEHLIKRVEADNITTYVACNLRFHTCLQFVKKYLTENPVRINEVNAYCGSYLPDWRPGKNYKEIYSAIKELGGGVHLDLIHELDYIYWFLGKPLTVNRILRNNSSLSISSVDYANYSLEYKDFTASVILNYYRRNPKRSLEILLEDGTLDVDLLSNRVVFNNKVIFESSATIGDTYKNQLEYFINCVVNGQKPMNDLRDSVEVLKICLPDE